MSLPNISEASIRHQTTAQSFQRGEAYYRDGHVASVTQRGNILQAEVEGSQALPYRVTLSFDSGGFTAVGCTCPYEGEGWCKHVVAAMLVRLHQPETIEKRPTLEQLLDRLDHLQTQRLVQTLVKQRPELIEEIDCYVNLTLATAPQKQPAKPPRRTTVDPAPFRRQVRQIIKNAVRYWEDGWGEDDPLADDILPLIEQAQEFTEQGDAHNALVILEAISAACAQDWDDVEDYGADPGDVASALDEAWTKAILLAELSEGEKVDLQVNLESWQDEWGADFSMSLEALRQGWDYPPLVRVLQGNVTEEGIWEGEPPNFADDLALIRLRILESQERYQEYLYLAEAEEQTRHFLRMLARLGRIAEAMEAAKSQRISMDDGFALAKTLREQGAVQQALEIAQLALKVPEHGCYELASWTSELAEGLGDRAAAINARTIAFKDRFSFKDYRKVEDLAGENWSEIKQELLKMLRTYKGWGFDEAKVDIFLHEGLIDDAIATATNIFYDMKLVHRVMEVAIAHNPDWVIKNAIHRAGEIIEQGKAQDYDAAVDWLKKARAAYLHAGRQPEWAAYRAKLVQNHGRKYKLMGLIKNAGLS